MLCVATSKPEPFARSIAERFGLTDCFDFIGGATLDTARTKKAEVIDYVLASVGAPEPEQVLMVGDRRHDVEEIALTGTGFTARLRGEEAELRQAEERLRRMRVYAAVELEEDPGSPGVTRLTCVEAGAKEEE